LLVEAVEKATLGWESSAAMPIRATNPISTQPQGEQETRKPSVLRWTISQLSNPTETEHSLKVKERSWNVYEKKGSERKEREGTGLSSKPKDSYVFVDSALCFKDG
jgi:hypothetical protein